MAPTSGEIRGRTETFLAVVLACMSLLFAMLAARTTLLLGLLAAVLFASAIIVLVSTPPNLRFTDEALVVESEQGVAYLPYAALSASTAPRVATTYRGHQIAIAIPLEIGREELITLSRTGQVVAKGLEVRGALRVTAGSAELWGSFEISRADVAAELDRRRRHAV